MTAKTPGAASGARAATISLGGDARAHPDLEPLIRPLFGADLTPTGDGETVPLIRRHPANPRRGDHDAIVKSIRNNGVYSPIKVQRSTGYVLAGNHTLDAILDQGGTSAPWVWLDVDDDEARRIMLDDNHVGDLGGYDDRMLLESLRAAEAAGDLLLSSYSVDDIGDLEAALVAAAYTPPVQTPSLADRFLVPPFTVLDARSGAWQDRKRRWLALGIQSEVGRGETADLALPQAAVQTNRDGVDAARYGRRANARSYQGQGQGQGQESLDAIRQKSSPYTKGNPRTDEVSAKIAATGARTLGQGLQATRDPATGELVYTETTAAGVSIFDPVLCELAYRWFTPPGGHVLDPFAGGSVRGIVAAALGHPYTGVELRPEQVTANETQRTILDRLPDAPAPTWVPGDSRVVVPTLDVQADLVFSCPPYADLEVYSDDPADLSAMPYDDFLTAYRAIIAAAVDRLRPDRYAVWVIGEVRDKRGIYRGLVPDTIRAFTDAGAALYNEAILVTPVGSLPIRAGRQFATGRKLGKTHQNVLVFCKGDPRAAADACGTVEVTMPDVDEETV